MTTKEVAGICGVSIPTITENAKKVGIVLEHGKAHDWTEEELKKVQAQLMKNQTSQGTQTELVKNEVLNRFNTGMTLVEIARSGNVEAMKELMDFAMQAVQETARAKELEAQNKLLLEQKEEAEKETERIYQVNKNFHANLYTASQVAKKLGITANMVGRIANEHGLKQDPIYGKLGKIQLNNGQWVNQFYYNDAALEVMEAVVG